MKILLPAILLLISTFCYSQKYVLIDKNISLPLSYTNSVTLQNSYKNMFVVEKDQLPRFIAELEKIAIILTDKNKPKPNSINFNVGKTRFIGIKVPLIKEERFDVVLTTDCDGIKVHMHISDSKISNASNAYFIKTWIKYIKSSLKDLT